MNKEIIEYNNSQTDIDKAICDRLAQIIDKGLTDAESKIWHAHPVWFLKGNPIVGYSKLKDSVRLMFWSGQSFDEDGLEKSGSFKAAIKNYTDVSDINKKILIKWLEESKSIQWDYKNIVKRKGKLVRL
ncbi:DUF1801 domain-containing protein [Candidatus Dojkabacteria bacterium]|uniref:DUF1801 domain-containing protein n=1 Tax=Candidatus Dojkabacteria bacterium TaxID=2099670 RepID=A0A955L6E8_9BACT|nr:DUF1801 domain-containing protein [Candidatus Dojkabacteria bacterium]